MHCPKCDSTNVNVQTVNDVHSKNRGCLMWVVWLVAAGICLFLGMWVLSIIFVIVPLITNMKVNTTNKTVAVCQDCAHTWDVGESPSNAPAFTLSSVMIVFIVVVLIVEFAPSSLWKSSSKPQSTVTTTEEKSTDSALDTPISTMYSVDVVGHEVLFDYADRRVIAVNLEYTNNTTETVEPSDHIEVIAFQNGVELSGAFVVLDFEPDVSGLDLHKEVKPGATLSLWVGYQLDDKSTVSVEIRGTRRAGSDVQVFDINPFARSAPVEVQGLDIQYVSHEFYAYENYTIMNLTLSFKNQSINDIRPDDYLYPVAFQDQIELAMFICSDRDITLHPEEVIELQYHYVIQDREIPVSFSLCLFDSEQEYYSEEIPVVS